MRIVKHRNQIKLINKTKWLIQKNFAEVVKRNKMDSPSSLEAISFYLKRNKLWSSSCQIPWGYFAASAAGLSPDSDFNWVITWGVNRLTALNRMNRSLAEFNISGIKSNISFCIAVLNNRYFNKGIYSTHTLDKIRENRICSI